MNNTIRIERAIKKMTQQQLAELVQVSRQTINTVELGKYIPSTVLALKIAKVFEKNVDDIFLLEVSDWDWLAGKWLVIYQDLKKESGKLLKNFIYVFDIQKKHIFVSQMIH